MLITVQATTVLAEVTARTDRSSMALDETLSLTLSRDGSSFFSSPDLAPLQKDFKVLGQSKSSSTNIINGNASSSTQWHISLAPRRQGKLEIPPLTVGKEQTKPLTVQVVAASQPKTRAEGVPIFIETSVDADSVYVQSQVILTLRIYWAVAARISEPADPEIKDALIKKLEDTKFSKTINGQSYRVFARKYAVFPQKSGSLEIPAQVVEVMVPSRQQSRGFFDLMGTMGETIKLRSEAKTVNVREKPSSYPASAVWLPTSALTFDERWSKNSPELQVGESATLTITVAADDLLGEQLPAIVLPETAGLKLYQGKAEVDNDVSSSGVNGVRRESIALIPTRAGTFELPEIRLPWWNKKQQKIEYAVLPARQLNATGTAAAPPIEPDNGAADVKANREIADSTPPPAAARIEQQRPLFWIALCSALAVAWLLTLFLLVRTRRQRVETDSDTKQEQVSNHSRREKEAFEVLTKACRADDPAEARKAIVTWLQIMQPDAKIQTFSDIEQQFAAPDFLQELWKLDRILYDSDGLTKAWKGEGLRQEAGKLRSVRSREGRNKEGLEQLYK